MNTILPDGGPYETKTSSSEARLIININLEVFVVVTLILSLLHIVIHNRMHTVKIIYYITSDSLKFSNSE
jgi:uncharacterized protein (UPF0262 family)